LDRAIQAQTRAIKGIASDRRSSQAWRNVLSNCSYFPPMLYSYVMNPVALPPGRDRLSTKPPHTGSETAENTIDTVRVACINGRTVEAPWARMTSGSVGANSAACLRILSASPPPSVCRHASCDRCSNPIAAVPAETPRRGPESLRRPDSQATISRRGACVAQLGQQASS
jgi:hypothetical protein